MVRIRKKKVTVFALCPGLPYPILSGGHMRMTSIFEAMSTFADIFLVCIADDVPAATVSWSRNLGIRLETMKRRPHTKANALISKIFMAATRDNLMQFSVHKFYLNAVFKKIKPDLVWLETPYLLRYALPWRSRVSLVVDYWGTSEGPARDFAMASGVEKIKAGLNWWSARGSELQYAPKVRNIVCVSQRDAKYFSRIAPISRVHVIPIGIVKTPVAKETVETKSPPGNGQTMILTGDLSFQPNIDAATHFANDIFPRIKARCPEAVFRVVGRNPAPELEHLTRKSGVFVTGWVPDLRQEISKSDIYVLPLRLGSGFRTKLLDVFPLGKPIVTTTVGTEGILLEHERNCLVADTPGQFADACIDLLRNPGKRHRLGASARGLAEDVYTQENIARLVKKAVFSAIR